MGLIITLVIFVLSTVILAVTTYIGFAEQKELKEKAEAANKKSATSDAKADWHRFQARVLRVYTGNRASLGEQEKVFLDEVVKFKAGELSFAKGQEDEKEFKDLIDKFEKEMPWSPAKESDPSPTYDKRLADKDEEIKSLQKQLADAKDAEKTAKDEHEATKQQRKDDKNTFDKDLAKVKLETGEGLKTLQTSIKVEMDKSLANAVEKENALVAKQKAEGERDKALLARDNLDKKLSLVEADKRTLQVKIDDLQGRISILQERAGSTAAIGEAEILDAEATKILKNWNRDWRIVEIDRTGKSPYINLGRADKIAPQVTFSIHAVGPDGKLNPNPKGTLEVVEVRGEKMARTRITSIRNEKTDPIIKGDRLFNPTWDPYRRKRVAIAGLADMGMDGTDSSEDLRRLLARQNVDVDAYISTKSDKGPKIEGKGISSQTDYLILADSLDALNHPKAKVGAYGKDFGNMMKDMKKKAESNAVQVIRLQAYLDMIGYRPPKTTKDGN